MILTKTGSRTCCFYQVCEGPEGFRKIREVCRKNFLQISLKSNFMVPSDEQKAKKLTSIELTTKILTVRKNELRQNQFWKIIWKLEFAILDLNFEFYIKVHH